MNRRNIVIGLGGLIGSAGVLGTGAFSASELERESSISVVDDSAGAIRFEVPRSYARMLLSPLKGADNALVSALGGRTSNTEAPNQTHRPNITLKPGESTPWRALIIGDSAGELLEQNYLVKNISPERRLKDTAWIRPGQAMRATQLSTANAKAIIDFADKAGLEYVHFDAGWYGDERDDESDATTVNAPNLDLQEVIKYGEQHDVGVFCYVNRRQINPRRDTLLPHYEKWGLSGVKLGFVDAAKVKNNDGWITVRTTVTAGDVEATYVEEKKVA